MDVSEDLEEKSATEPDISRKYLSHPNTPENGEEMSAELTKTEFIQDGSTTNINIGEQDITNRLHENDDLNNGQNATKDVVIEDNHENNEEVLNDGENVSQDQLSEMTINESAAQQSENRKTVETDDSVLSKENSGTDKISEGENSQYLENSQNINLDLDESVRLEERKGYEDLSDEKPQIKTEHNENTGNYKVSNGHESDVTKPEDEWLDILGNGLLRKKIFKTGDGKEKPVAGQEVCIKSEGMLENGNKVDIYEEIVFIVGDADVITAWDLCVATMVQGEICELITAPRFAYGSIGRQDDICTIAANAQITYVLELLHIKPGPNIKNMTDEQRVTIGDAKRERGNELFQREDYSQAVYSYSRALKYLKPSTSQDVVKLQVKCWNNIAASHLKLQEYSAAKIACDSVLSVEPSNVKALFRKGKVLCAQGEYEEATGILKKANSLEPENKLVRKEFGFAKGRFDEERRKQRDMYQRMVNGLGDKTKEKDDTFFTWPVILGITGVAIGGIVAALLFSRH